MSQGIQSPPKIKVNVVQKARPMLIGNRNLCINFFICSASFRSFPDYTNTVSMLQPVGRKLSASFYHIFC